MKDVVAIQYAFYRGYRSSPFFNGINVVLGRQLLQESEIKMDAICLTPRNGKSGAGMIVNLPVLRVPKPNSRQREREFSVGIYEEPNINFTPGTGTMTPVEDWGDLALDFLYGWVIQRSGGINPDDAAVFPDLRFQAEGYRGVIAKVTLRQERTLQPRCANPVVSANLGLVTIIAPDNSLIYYTTDGFSFPGPDTDGTLPEEQAAQLYQKPFPAPSGTIVQAMTHPNQTSTFPSHLVTFQVP